MTKKKVKKKIEKQRRERVFDWELEVAVESREQILPLVDFLSKREPFMNFDFYRGGDIGTSSEKWCVRIENGSWADNLQVIAEFIRENCDHNLLDDD